MVRKPSLRDVSRPERVLADHHRQHLYESGLTDETIDVSGVHTEAVQKTLAMYANHKRSAKWGPAIVFPYYHPASPGSERKVEGPKRFRPDSPRTTKEGKVIKYEQMRGWPTIPYFPPRSLASRLNDVSVPLVFCEGEKKSLAVDQATEFCVVGAPGVWNFHDSKNVDRWVFHKFIRDFVTVKGRDCIIAFDADIADNELVSKAAERLAGMACEAGAASVTCAQFPAETKGADDFLVAHGPGALRAILLDAEPIEPGTTERVGQDADSCKFLKDCPGAKGIKLPPNYSVTDSGMLILDTGEEGGEPSVVMGRMALPVSVRKELYEGTEQFEISLFRGGSWQTTWVDGKLLADTKTLAMGLRELGADVGSRNASAVSTFYQHLDNVNDTRWPRSLVVSRHGWHRGTFVLDESIGEVKLDLDRRNGRELTAHALGTRGDRDASLAAVREAIWTDPHAAAVIFAALAAPLLKPLGAPNFALHLIGDSSTGKTSMARIAASLFGDPKNKAFFAGWNTTQVGLETRAECLCDLPLFLDESGLAKPWLLQTIAYMLESGSGKTRGAKAGGNQRTYKWRSVTVSTGEHPFAGSQASTGAQARVIECFVSGFGELGAADVDRLRHAAESNFGWLGREWIEYLMTQSDEDWQKWKVVLASAAQAYAQGVSGGGVGARQAGYAAVLTVAESMAHHLWGIGQAGGLTMANWWLGRADTHLSPQPLGERAMELVEVWVEANRHAFPNLAEGVTDDRHREVFGFRTSDRIYISPVALRKFFEGENISMNTVLKVWRKMGVLHHNPGRLQKRVRIGDRSVWMVGLFPVSTENTEATENGSENVPF